MCTLFETLWEGRTRTVIDSELDLLCSVLAARSIYKNAKTLKRIVARTQHFNRLRRRSLTINLTLGSKIPQIERSGTTSGVWVIRGIDDCTGIHHAIVVDCRGINDTLNRFSAPGEHDFENLAL